MSAEAIQLVLDPGLVEEAVLLAIRTSADQDEFRAARDALYALAEAESERAFTELHFGWFDRLGLDRSIRLALAELPLIARSCARCVVSRSLSARDEGADLLVNPEARGISARTVLVKVRASAFGEPASMLAMLRSELLHVADMLDPDFGYEPTVKSADYGPTYGQLVRERYRVLWNVTVASRLVSRGVAGADAKAQAYQSFVAAFPMPVAAADEAFARFFGGRTVTHAEMMSFAASGYHSRESSIEPSFTMRPSRRLTVFAERFNSSATSATDFRASRWSALTIRQSTRSRTGSSGRPGPIGMSPTTGSDISVSFVMKETHASSSVGERRYAPT